MKLKRLNHGLLAQMRHFTGGYLRIRTRAAGFTFTELMVAGTIGSLVSLGLASMMLMTGRLEKSILTQQLSLNNSMKGIETINREITRQRQEVMKHLEAAGLKWDPQWHKTPVPPRSKR
jgi:type II secretory pathway component PulJ